MSGPTGSLSPDEGAFYAAWLGTLWPRYRPLFEGGAGGRRFEWRAAVYPLWLGIPGAWWPIVAVTALTFGVTTAAFPGARSWEWLVVAGLTVLQVGLWPAAVAYLAYMQIAAGVSASAFWLGGMAALSAVFGVAAPRWIVAAGRRRWRRHAARVAAGAAPAPPRSVTATHLLNVVMVVALVGVPSLPLLFPLRHDDHEAMFVAAMRSDLRNLVTAQERFFADSLRYTMDLNALDYAYSAGVTLQLVAASDAGWAAIARHESTGRACSIFVGTAASPIEDGREGEPVCER